MLKSLLHKGLILESGRAEGPGRPILYSTSPEFLQHFGLNSILEMPPLAKPEEEEDTHDEMLKGKQKRGREAALWMDYLLPMKTIRDRSAYIIPALLMTKFRCTRRSRICLAFHSPCRWLRSRPSGYRKLD